MLKIKLFIVVSFMAMYGLMWGFRRPGRKDWMFLQYLIMLSIILFR